MIALLDTSEDLDVCAAELDMQVGQLITPLTEFANRGGTFAIDNGAFSNFDSRKFLRLLERNKAHRDKCIFVAAPDVVGSARRTLEVFHHWFPKLHGWPIALVAQDGQEDLPIPWHAIEAVFIGGSTQFKLSPAAAQIVKAAKAIGKWVHIGRVNTPERFDYFLSLGADSIDGSGIARYSHMRRELKAEVLFDCGRAAR
jgi:hypothetical protein